MKVFNQEVNNCDDCNFNETTFTSLNDVKYYCNYNNMKIKDESIIDSRCPFNKSLTKEDIESFGFDYNEVIDEYCNKDITITNRNYTNKNIFIISKYTNKRFDGNITSKPHLEFILQSLNMIK